MVEYDTHDWRSHLFDIQGSMVKEIVYRVLSCVGFAAAVTVVDQVVDFNVGIDSRGHALIGTALGLLLVFRTNAAYDRFWEGRKLWGSIINESRNLSRAAATHLTGNVRLAGEVIRWGIAFAWATMYQLRKERGLGPVVTELSAEEAREAREADHPPLAVARQISVRLLDARKQGLISEYVMVSIDQNVQLLIDYMGACERIRNTQLPFAYMVHLRRALIVYCFTLPFALVDDFGWLTILVTLFIAYALFGIEEIGVEIEGPFGDDENDLPLESFCQTIERNMRGVLNTLGEEVQPNAPQVTAAQAQAAPANGHDPDASTLEMPALPASGAQVPDAAATNKP
jgi:ion channel-forming bestrophin family protein